MSRLSKLFTANAIAAAGLCSAAIALSSEAAADPALPPAIPGVPALSMLQQLATNPAGAATLLQTAATALTGGGALPGMPSAVPVSPIQGVPDPAGVPATAATAPAATGSILPIPMLNQLGIPGNLANLTPTDVPFPVAVGNQPGIAPAPVNAPAGIPPASAPPVAPMIPGGAGLAQLLPLGALP